MERRTEISVGKRILRMTAELAAVLLGLALTLGILAAAELRAAWRGYLERDVHVQAVESVGDVDHLLLDRLE